MIAEYGKRVAQNHKSIHIFAYQLRKQCWKWKLISKGGISLGENEWMVASQEKDKGRCGSRFHNLTILDPQLLKLLFSCLENDKGNVCWIFQQARACNFSSTSQKTIYNIYMNAIKHFLNSEFTSFQYIARICKQNSVHYSLKIWKN